MLPTLSPFTLASVARNILPFCNDIDFRTELEKALGKLMNRYKTTFDLCILQTITSIQVTERGYSQPKQST